ncbi:MAG: GNAT family N-acetyltransferase [Phycisphaerales bacterium]|nr:GNAT family N-acetyltransferase [Planctomycetota bacterium]MCH8507179.1 GNAT family N-acetyltransferase [Phycisphaerales bacterium]
MNTSKPGLSVRDVTSNSEWNKLVDNAFYSTVYHRSGWLRALSETAEVKIYKLALEDSRGALAIWPIGVFRKGPLRIGASPLPGWNTAYLGPLFTQLCGDKVDAVRIMMQSKFINRPSFLTCKLMDTEIDLSELGLKKEKDFYTYQINLTESEGKIWNSLKGKCRTAIRKGEKNNIKIIAEDNRQYIQDFMDMATDVYAKSNLKPPYSSQFIAAVDEYLRECNELVVMSAFHSGCRIATVIFPHDNNSAVYFAGGTFSQYKQLAPSNLLHWRTMMFFKEMGVQTYDFISCYGSPGKFKETFGPQKVLKSTHWEYTRSPIVEHAKNWYEARKKRQLRKDC